MTNFLAANWLWIALIAAVIILHRSGHGCGMHGHQHDHSSEPEHAHHGTGKTNVT